MQAGLHNPQSRVLKDPMRFTPRYLAPALLTALGLAFFPPGLQADDLNEYRIRGNLFSDYRPAHQRANPGAEWERIKAREQRQIDREFEQRRNRSQSYGGRIDNRDYSRPGRRSDDRIQYHSADRNRHRNSGRIDNNAYGAAASPSPSARSTPQWIGPDYAAQRKNAWRPNATPESAARTSPRWIGPDYAAQRKNAWRARPQATPPARQASNRYTAGQQEKSPKNTTAPVPGKRFIPTPQNPSRAAGRPQAPTARPATPHARPPGHCMARPARATLPTAVTRHGAPHARPEWIPGVITRTKSPGTARNTSQGPTAATAASQARAAAPVQGMAAC